MSAASDKGLVLSTFPGIGMLDIGFEEAGFCVVRGPDLLWGGDIHKFHPPAGRFDGVIGGPPCQAFSQLRHIVEANGYKTAPNLIPEFERCVLEAMPDWFLMENVPAAPLPNVPGYGLTERILDNHWLGETAQGRKRRFSFGYRKPAELKFHIDTPALVPIEREPAVCASGSGRSRPVAVGGSGKRKRAIGAGDLTGPEAWRRALSRQGLPPDFLDDAPFTKSGKFRVVGNGVPLPMARAVAEAVVKALGP